MATKIVLPASAIYQMDARITRLKARMKKDAIELSGLEKTRNSVTTISGKKRKKRKA